MLLLHQSTLVVAVPNICVVIRVSLVEVTSLKLLEKVLFGGTVTFGGGHKPQVVGKGTVCIPGLPELKNVRFIKGLTSNLISMSQLCDDGVVEVRFSKYGCKIIGKGGNEIVRVARSKDNCYSIDSVNDAKEVVCNKVVNETSVLWHQRLGHVNFRDLHGKSVDQTLYRSMIGSLLHLIASRPDISYSVGVCARFQSDPKESHLFAVKRIIKYVSGTVEFRLWYTYDTCVNLVGYSDADWAGCSDDRKSTSGGVFYVGNNLVAWHSKNQNSVSLFTVEAKYVAAGSCCTQLLWTR
ncbi:hypothetical protein L3X38_015279 [Prunus dulcis]|uniref:Uncharacterized protein n=1 Tax=Prunus dulcis TaxID=3755 RepID=A0AAD4WPT9_PRUDU|nr:hypothetical protein L3X38_015279 [Prunus dulcis]